MNIPEIKDNESCQTKYESCQTKYDSCQREYNLLYEEKIQNYEQLNKCSQELTNVNNLVNSTIQWNPTVYKNSNNMSYTEAAKAVKTSFYAALITILIDLCLGMALLILDKRDFWRKWILCISFVSFVGLAVILTYISYLKY